MNNQSSKSSFLKISLLYYQHYSIAQNICVKIVYNTAATEANRSLIAISGIFEGPEMFDTNNKQRCLDFWRLAHFVSNFISSGADIQMN